MLQKVNLLHNNYFSSYMFIVYILSIHLVLFYENMI